MFYKRLFASYYFLLLKTRKISKSRIEDSQAVKLTLVSNMLVLIMLIICLQKAKIIFPSKSSSVIYLLMVVIAVVILLIAENYFFGNRQRRNAIIDSFRVLSINQKRTWYSIAIALIVVPILLIWIFLIFL